jgi:hypothetical protein
MGHKIHVIVTGNHAGRCQIRYPLDARQDQARGADGAEALHRACHLAPLAGVFGCALGGPDEPSGLT